MFAPSSALQLAADLPTWQRKKADLAIMLGVQAAHLLFTAAGMLAAQVRETSTVTIICLLFSGFAHSWISFLPILPYTFAFFASALPCM